MIFSEMVISCYCNSNSKRYSVTSRKVFLFLFSLIFPLSHLFFEGRPTGRIRHHLGAHVHLIHVAKNRDWLMKVKSLFTAPLGARNSTQGHLVLLQYINITMVILLFVFLISTETHLKSLSIYQRVNLSFSKLKK